MPEITRDSDDMKKLFDKIGLIPFSSDANSTYQRYLQFLKEVSEQSYSAVSCMSKIKDFGFSRPFPLPISGGFDTDEATYTDAEFKQRKDALAAVGITSKVLKEVTDSIFNSVVSGGNAWLRVRIVNIAGVVKVNIKPLPFAQMGRAKYDSSTKNYCLKVRTWERLDKNDVTVYPCSVDGVPYFVQKSGALETVIQIKSGLGDSDYYGTPLITSFIYFMLLEWQIAEYTNRETANDFMSKMLVLFEDMPMGALSDMEKKAAIRDARVGASNAMSKKSTDSTVVAMMGYPADSKHPPTVTLTPAMTNHEYLRGMIDNASKVVHIGFQTSPVITGTERPASGLGLNSFKQEFDLWNASTLKAWQEQAEYWWAEIFRYITAAVELPLLQDLAIGFNSATENLKVIGSPPAMEAAQLGTLNELMRLYMAGEISRTGLIVQLTENYNYDLETAESIANDTTK